MTRVTLCSAAGCGRPAALPVLIGTRREPLCDIHLGRLDTLLRASPPTTELKERAVLRGIAERAVDQMAFWTGAPCLVVLWGDSDGNPLVYGLCCQGGREDAIAVLRHVLARLESDEDVLLTPEG